MMMRLMRMGLAATLLAPALAAAQPPGTGRGGHVNLTEERPDKKGPPPIYEDIEVLRRLLAGKLAGRDATTNSAQNWLRYNDYLGTKTAPTSSFLLEAVADSYGRGRSSTSGIDGVYLDGKGVVLTITMPAGARDPRPSAAPPKIAKPQSEWERTRQQLRGDSPEPVAKTETTTPTLGDVLVSVLADNGQHLRISNNEDVTIVATFRPVTPAAVSTTSPSNPGLYDVPVTVAPGLAAPATQPSLAPTGHGQTFRDFNLLGDLHLRQRQYTQAQEAFQKALTQEPKGDPKQLAEVFRKLAETKLQTGKLEEAKAMIESAVTYERQANDDAAGKGRTETTSAPMQRTPAKMIITSSKRHLDEVGAGKISLDEFRKQLKVELIPHLAK